MQNIDKIPSDETPIVSNGLQAHLSKKADKLFCAEY